MVRGRPSAGVSRLAVWMSSRCKSKNRKTRTYGGLHKANATKCIITYCNLSNSHPNLLQESNHISDQHAQHSAHRHCLTKPSNVHCEQKEAHTADWQGQTACPGTPYLSWRLPKAGLSLSMSKLHIQLMTSSRITTSPVLESQLKGQGQAVFRPSLKWSLRVLHRVKRPRCNGAKACSFTPSLPPSLSLSTCQIHLIVWFCLLE